MHNFCKIIRFRIPFFKFVLVMNDGAKSFDKKWEFYLNTVDVIVQNGMSNEGCAILCKIFWYRMWLLRILFGKKNAQLVLNMGSWVLSYMK